MKKGALEMLSHPESTNGHHGWAWRKIFNLKVLRRLENAILRLIFASTVNADFNYTLFQLLKECIVKVLHVQALRSLQSS